jgi:hypothetical protein
MIGSEHGSWFSCIDVRVGKGMRSVVKKEMNRRSSVSRGIVENMLQRMVNVYRMVALSRVKCGRKRCEICPAYSVVSTTCDERIS